MSPFFSLGTSSPALASVSFLLRSSMSLKRFIPIPCPFLPYCKVPCSRAVYTLRSLRATPYPAIQLLEDRLAVLVALLVITYLPKVLGRERPQTRADLLHSEFVVALYGELSIPEALLSVGEGDVEKLGVGAHDLLAHLLEGLLLLLSLLLEGLLLLGLLHPLLGRLLDGLLLLLCLPREVGPWGIEELHVGVDQLLSHLLGVL